jgi:flagellar protein FliL
MATETTETPAPAEAAATKAGGGLLKAVGITIGLFLMMLITSLASPIIGCRFLYSMTPGCPEPVVEVDASGKAVEEPKAPPVYLPLDPPLVASFQDQGQIRFLQVAVELMARDDKVIEGLKTHMPVIRNNLLMMMGGQTMATLTSRDEKEKLRAAALAEVQRILKENSGGEADAPGVEDLYFTSFVVQ